MLGLIFFTIVAIIYYLVTREVYKERDIEYFRTTATLVSKIQDDDGYSMRYYVLMEKDGEKIRVQTVSYSTEGEPLKIGEELTIDYFYTVSKETIYAKIISDKVIPIVNEDNFEEERNRSKVVACCIFLFGLILLLKDLIA